MAQTAIQEYLARFSRQAGAAVSGIGVLVLFGWLLHIQFLMSVLPRFTAMSPFSAVLFFFGGLALRRSVRVGTASAKALDGPGLALSSLVVLGGAAELADNVFGLHNCLKEPVFSCASGLVFLVCGVGLLLLNVETRQGFRPAQVFILFGALISLLALIGYAYGVPPLYTIGPAGAMALHSAIAFALFCAGILAARPDRGVMKAITDNTTGGAMARRLLPAAILIPLALGTLRFFGEEGGYFEMQFGVAIVAVTNMLIFVTLIWWNARLLSQAEIEREQALQRLKQTSAELERSNTDLQQFASVASHDLNEPLRMIAGYLELLRHHAGDKLDDASREFIGHAVDGSQRMSALIAGLLAYARVGTRGQALKPVACGHALDSALANLKVAIEESGAKISREPLPAVNGDEVQLVQVFQNFIGNGIKFRRREIPPEIHIGAVQKGPDWVFHVRDNGIGIEQKYFDRIFVLFQRLHTREEYPGTGMGLAICKKIIERHGGRVWVDSAPGGGTTFFFTLPVQKTS